MVMSGCVSLLVSVIKADGKDEYQHAERKWGSCVAGRARGAPSATGANQGR